MTCSRGPAPERRSPPSRPSPAGPARGGLAAGSRRLHRRQAAGRRAAGRPRQGAAQLEHYRAAEQQARLNLGYTTITAPVDGTVGARSLRVGQYVQAGTQLMAVVPLDAVYIVANFKETQLTRRAPRPAGRDLCRHVPGCEDPRPCRQRRPGDRPAIRPAAAGQRHRQLHQDRAAPAGEDRAGSRSLGPRRWRAGLLRPGMSVEPTIDTKAADAKPRPTWSRRARPMIFARPAMSNPRVPADASQKPT